jgi:hypothetical protein
MAITENEYTGNGSTVLYSFTFPYLEVADIKVSLDGTLTTAYTLANATTVQFNTAPANGVAIRLFRQTNDDALNAQFFPGSAIRSTDLNNNFTQNLYVTQESNRDATQGITTADAATATANTALSNSSAAVSTANTASSNASAAVSTANTASSNASAAVSTANTASSNATTAVSTANAATATANSAASDAATAISTANSALSTANTASTTATNAVNTANSASSAASSAVSTANTASSNASAAVSTANTASSNATSAVNTANSALSTANAAASAVANAILYDIVANVAAIPASPANNDAVEVTDSTGIESFTPLTSIPGGFAGNSGLSVRIVYTTTGNTWTWIQYFPNDPETRYLKEAVTTSDTAPVSPSDGDLWYDSVGGRTYVYYDDGDTSQWVDTSPQGSGVSDAISEGNTSAEVIDTGSDGRFVVTTEGSERLRITSAGLVGIGTNSPGSYNSEADDLVIYNSGDGGITIATGSSTGQNKIYFAKGTTGSEQYQGYIVYNQSATSNGSMVFGVGGSNKVAITEAGNVGIGITSPSARLNIAEGNANAVSTTSTDVNRVLLTDTSGSTSAGAGYSLDFEGTYGGLGRIAISKSNSATAGTSRDTGAFRLFLNQNLGEDSYAAFTEALTIDSNGTDQGLIYRFRGTEQIRVDNSGRLLVGTSSTSSNAIAIVQGNPTLTSAGRLYLTRRNETTASNDELGILHFAGSAHNSAAEIGSQRDGGTWTTGSSHPTRLTFSTTANGASTPTERLRIDSSGRVGIGTTSPDYTVDINGELGITEGQPVTWHNGSGSPSGQIFCTSGDEMVFRNTSIGLERMRIDSSGRVGIGATPSTFDGNGDNLVISSSGATGITIDATSSTNSSIHFADGPTGTEAYRGYIVYTHSQDAMFFGTSGTERVRIDSSGRLLVGTSSTRTVGFWDTPQFLFEGTDYQKSSLCIYNNQNSIYGAVISLGHSRGTSVGSNTILQNNDFIGVIAFHGSDGSNEVRAGQIAAYVDGTPGANDMPGRLVFSTTADGASDPTERLRLSSNGFVSAPGVYSNTTAVAANVNVDSNGLIRRSTSSAKYKTDIETLQDSYADALLGCRPVWYRSTCENDNSSWGWWGFIAEEVAAIDPRLVQWKTSEVTYDENGSAVSTPCDPEPEGVAYDRFVPHLLNLIKRQQQAIETLEAANTDLAARLTALEGGTN